MMMVDTVEFVREWHDAFKVPVRTVPAIPADRVKLRIDLIREELAELEAAIASGDPAAVLHEACDLQYVLDGMLVEFGLARLKRTAFCEVHRANMSKLGADGMPVLRADGKVLKGPHFRAADVAGVTGLGREGNR